MLPEDFSKTYIKLLNRACFRSPLFWAGLGRKANVNGPKSGPKLPRLKKARGVWDRISANTGPRTVPDFGQHRGLISHTTLDLLAMNKCNICPCVLFPLGLLAKC